MIERVEDEIERQDMLWGRDRDHDDGTGTTMQKELARMARCICDHETEANTVQWQHILSEEFYEALAESDPKKLQVELCQVAAVATAWARAIEERGDIK
jgi:hypothetical protein